jgi:hypothetical protein
MTQTTQALAQVLRDHRAQMIETLVMQAPAAGSGYEDATPEQLQPRMAGVVDACIASIDQGRPELLGQFMKAAAEERVRDGYSLESLITLAMFVEGALTDTAELAFEGDADQKQEARQIIRTLGATAEQVLDPMIAESGA